MLKKINRVPRRAFLHGSSVLIALPLMESLGWRRFASAAPQQAPPKRTVFLSFGWGVTKETWYPDRNAAGPDYELPPGLQPLARHKKDLTLIQNLTNQFNNEAHWGSTFYLTGANRYAEPGQSFHNSISADQVAAETLGKDTRFTSLPLGCQRAADSGHGPGLSLAWNRQGKPVAGLNQPLQVFNKLFSKEKTPLAEREAMLRQQRSVLDAVLEDARSVGRSLSKVDSDKLAEYLQSIRDIEIRLSKEEQWLDVPKRQPQQPIEAPSAEAEGYEEIKLMYDLIVAALQVDATRVVTYRQPVDSLIRSQGATITSHNMSHYAPGMRMEVSQMRDQKQSELLAYLLDRLKSVKEPDGGTLFDQVSLSYGSNISSIHYLNNCPTIVTGGAAGVKHGRQLVMKPKTPLCNLWLSLLRGVGLNVDKHGDSNGVIDELFV